MREIMTGDGSMTFHSEAYGESYHSITGAVEEAFKKFVEPTHIAGLADLGMVSILDVCFGLGYNTAAALDKILEVNPGCKVVVVGLEKDREILSRIPGLSPQIKNYHVIKELVKSNKNEDSIINNYEYTDKNVRINLLVCDALEGVKSIKLKFDIIFHDPFSPKKNPELWTEDFFRQLRKLIKPDGILTTYSCAGMVRRNLKAAGFEVKDGPCVGRRSPSTVAVPV
ncbi:hypothetical protein JXB28_01670 [Candidatus Woesearchaeota archaeon]|nr:hypothetical protein [Candidatus Woesearchaeota archaeon]